LRTFNPILAILQRSYWIVQFPIQW